MSSKIKIADLNKSVSKITKLWSDEVNEEIKESVKEIAKESKSDLKVAGDFKNRSGRYRKGWNIFFHEGRYALVATIYNKRYQLTHLLESGHAKYLWGKATGEEVRAFPHIGKVNEEAQKRLEEEIIRRLS